MSLLYPGSIDHRAGLAPLNGTIDGNPGWTDLQGNVQVATGAALLTNDPLLDTPWRLLCFSRAQNDTLSFTFQMPHAWNKGAVHPHIHFMPLADPVAPEVIRFIGQWAWAQDGLLVPANVGWTTFLQDFTVQPGTMVNRQQVQLFPTILAPANAHESDILLFFLERNGTAPQDTYTTSKPGGGAAAANVGLLSVDVHYQQEKLGSQIEFP